MGSGYRSEDLPRRPRRAQRPSWYPSEDETKADDRGDHCKQLRHRSQLAGAGIGLVPTVRGCALPSGSSIVGACFGSDGLHRAQLAWKLREGPKGARLCVFFVHGHSEHTPEGSSEEFAIFLRIRRVCALPYDSPSGTSKPCYLVDTF